MNGDTGPDPRAPSRFWGYHNWSLSSLCGPTPQFAWPGTRITAQCDLPADDWPRWWNAALVLIDDLQRRRPTLQPWREQLRQRVCQPQGPPPAALAWQALEAALQLPAYPLQLDAAAADGAAPPLLMHSACPYEPFVVRAMQLIGTWLAWSHQAWDQRRLALPARHVQDWCAAFEHLPHLLPAPPLRSLHRQLWQQGIAWRWLGGAQTRIGSGARQRILEGVPSGLDLSDPGAWQVPTYTVTGSVGKTTTARLLWQLLQPSCSALALAASDGAWIGGRLFGTGDCIGGTAAQALLADPSVQAAVFEQGRGGLIKQGVPYSRSDVAILLNVQAVHLGSEGVHTLEQMADVKAMGLQPARLVVLNLEDAQCLRIGSVRDPASCVWFGVEASGDSLSACSLSARAAVGVERDGSGEPAAVLVWERGELARRISLDGVAPFHGSLGPKTLEELLAVVAAAWVGPLPVSDWAAGLSLLRLDAANHSFRASLHRQGRVLFVLDKADELVSVQLLVRTVNGLAQREGCSHRILILCRSAAVPSQNHVDVAHGMYEAFDAFVCFDRPDTYSTRWARPEYAPGDVPRVLSEAFEQMNARCGRDKPVTLVPDWPAAEQHLRRTLAALTGRVLVVINQPSTGVVELNRRIIDFVSAEWPESEAEASSL